MPLRVKDSQGIMVIPFHSKPNVSKKLLLREVYENIVFIVYFMKKMQKILRKLDYNVMIIS